MALACTIALQMAISPALAAAEAPTIAMNNVVYTPTYFAGDNSPFTQTITFANVRVSSPVDHLVIDVPSTFKDAIGSVSIKTTTGGVESQYGCGYYTCDVTGEQGTVTITYNKDWLNSAFVTNDGSQVDVSVGAHLEGGGATASGTFTFKPQA